MKPTQPARAIRIGHQIRIAGPVDEMIAEAKAAEAAGFDIITVPDHVNETLMSPMIALATIARETSTIRLGTFRTDGSTSSHRCS